MMNKTVKVLLFIAIIALSLILIPSISKATDQTVGTFDELVNAINNAQENDTITLTANIDVTAPITVSGKTITINGAGFSINGTDELGQVEGANKSLITTMAGSNVTLTNVKLQNSPKYGVQAYDGGKVILNQVTLSNNAYGGVLVNGGTVEVINLSLIGNKTGIEISKSKSITSNNEPTLIMNGKLTSDATDNVIYLANDPNDNTSKFVIENTDNTENKILASGNKVVVTDVNNNILYTSNETKKQIDVEDYEENHPETEENNTIEENNKVENPHTGDSIFGYVATGIIAVMGIAILTKKNNK